MTTPDTINAANCQTLDRLISAVVGWPIDDEPDPIAAWGDWVRELVSFAAGVTPQRWAAMRAEHPDLLKEQPRAARLYGRYVRQCEVREAQALLAVGADAGDRRSIQAVGDFGRRSYERVRDMFDHVDFTGRRRAVMVGCGPLPVTLWHLLDRTPIERAVGIDADAAAVEFARRASQRMGRERAVFESADGRTYDYRGADVIYIANLVRPKADVLARVAQTVPAGTPVILRDPHGVGELLTDRGRDTLDPRQWKVTGEGEGDAGFLSRHVFLRRL
jgi:hypothetical protein